MSQVSIPLWALVHLPVVVTLSTAAFTPNGWVHSILYVLFENAMGIVKLGAVIAGAARSQCGTKRPHVQSGTADISGLLSLPSREKWGFAVRKLDSYLCRR